MNVQLSALARSLGFELGVRQQDLERLDERYDPGPLDMAIMELFEQGLVTEETALLYCTNKGVVTRGLDKIKKTRGETTSSLTGLALDVEYGKKK